MTLFLLLLTLLGAYAVDDLTPAPTRSKLERKTSFPTTHNDASQEDEWISSAMEKMFVEKTNRQRAPLVLLDYQGSVAIDIIFQDDSSLPGGSYFRTIWTLFVHNIRNGIIRQGMQIFDYSLDGNSAIAVAHFSKILGLKAVPFNIEFSKLNNLNSLGAVVRKVQPTQLENSVRLEAFRNGLFLNSAGAFASSNPPEDPEMNIYEEVLQQLRTEKNINRIDFFISGSLIRSISSTAPLDTKIVAVDSEFSSLFDFLVNNRFQKTSGSSVWRFPGIPGQGAGLTGPLQFGKNINVNKEMADEIIKLPDLATVAAMHVLQSKGIQGGPSAAANFLAALVLASTENIQSNLMTILTVAEDSASRYNDTYLDEGWVKKNFGRHGAIWGFDCWKTVIEESTITGWNPLDSGLDRGCPTGFT